MEPIVLATVVGVLIAELADQARLLVKTERHRQEGKYRGHVNRRPNRPEKHRLPETASTAKYMGFRTYQ